MAERRDDSMRDILLVFGTTYNQVPLIKKAQQAGYSAWAAGAGDTSQCEKHADRIIHVDTSDKETLLSVVKTHNIRGLITCGTSTAVCTIAYINEALGLSDKIIPYDVSLNATLKDRFRDILLPFRIVPPGHTISTVHELVAKSTTQHYPVVLKPVDAGGGKGIEILESNSKPHAVEAFSRSVSYSRAGKLVVEEYIEGVTLGVESITIDGSTYALAVAEKTVTGFPHCVTTGLFFPSRRLESHVVNILKVNSQAINELGIGWGATHIDMVLRNDGTPFIVDIGPRLAGGPIASSLIESATGYDLYRAAIDLCTGRRINAPELSRPASRIYGSHFIVRDVHGTITSIQYDEQLIEQHELRNFTLLKKPGDTINGVTTDGDRLAMFHFSAASEEELEEKIEAMENGFHVDVSCAQVVQK